MNTKELTEYKEILEEICEKYNYDSQDKDGNDSLKTVLQKVLPAMLKDANQEDRQLFYQMLRHTPIVVTEKITQEYYDKLEEKYIGINNLELDDEDVDLGEYEKNIGAAAFVSNVIIDDQLNIKGKKSFVYIQKIDGSAKEFFGTDINVSHLIHELGHAWHAEKDEYTIQKDGTLRERIGTAEFIYTLSKKENGKILQKLEKESGLMIEEAMNTIKEEEATANYMGISLEEMQSEYDKFLVPSAYQGYMSDFIRYMMSCIGKEDLEKFRLYGDVKNRDRINSLMEKTEYWQNREEDIKSSSNSQRNYDKKRAVIDGIESADVKEFFAKYENIYFPDISQMTPFDKINNVLEQQYSLDEAKYGMGIENYRAFLDRLGYEGYSLINQAKELINVKITPSAVTKNALQKGITAEQVNQANNIEQKELNTERNNDEQSK